VRDLVQRQLEDLGDDWVVAASGEAALERVAEVAQPIDLLITDVVIAEMSGPALYHRLAESRPRAWTTPS